MPEHDELQDLSLDDLRQRCSQLEMIEGSLADHTDREDLQPYCFELFRRAIRDGDQMAWEVIYENYQPQVDVWVKGHLYYTPGMEDPEFFTNRAFEKMWVGLTPDKFEMLADINALERYIQMCVHSALVQNLRGRAKTVFLDEYIDPVSEREALSASAVPPIPVPAGLGIENRAYIKTQAETLWNMLQGRLQDEKERRFVNARYVLGLYADQIPVRYSDLFNEGQEVVRVRDRLIERLNQDPEIRGFFDLEEVELDLEEQLLGMLYRIFCPESQELREFYLGFLLGEQSASIQAHCSDCPHCTRELDQLMAYLDALQSTG